MDIEYLEWDSQFFEKKIGKINFHEGNELILEHIKGYDLVYLFTAKILNKLSMKPIATKVDLFLELNVVSSKGQFYNIRKFNGEKDSLLQLRRLAILSGKYSRFNKDKFISRSKFTALYEAWIDKSILDNGIDVFVCEEKGNLIGFVTIEYGENWDSKIGLISVHENYRGKGIATALISFAKEMAATKNYKRLFVTTQDQNHPAMLLYFKNGFIIKKSTLIYHIWKT